MLIRYVPILAIARHPQFAAFIKAAHDAGFSRFESIEVFQTCGINALIEHRVLTESRDTMYASRAFMYTLAEIN